MQYPKLTTDFILSGPNILQNTSLAFF